MKGWLLQPRVGLVLGGSVLLLALGGASFARRYPAVEPLVGVEWTRSSAGPVALHVLPDSPARRAGLEAGDVLLRIGSRQVVHAVEADELGWRATAGQPVDLLVRRGAEERLLRVEPQWTPRSEPYVYLVIVGLAFLLSGSFIALRWPDIRGGLIYAALAAAVFVHLILSPAGRADTLDWTVGWCSDLAGFLWPALLLHLGVALTRRTMPWRRFVLGCAYGISCVLMGGALWISPATLGGAYRWSAPAAAIENWVDRPGYLWMSAAVLFTITILAKSLSRSPSALHRSQMRWMLWGLALGLGPFVVLYAVPWAVGATPLPEWARFLAVAPMLLVPAAFTAALARYRLYDFDLWLLRVAREVTAIIFTFAVLAAMIFLLRRGVSELVPLSRGASRYIGLLTAALLYPQLRRLVKAAIERAFYKQRYSYRATLLDWARELNAETDLSSILTLLHTRVRDTLGLPQAQVLIRAGERRFEALGDSCGSRTVDLEPPLVALLDNQASVSLGEGGLPGLPWVRCLFSMRVKNRLTAVLAIADRERAEEEPLTSEDRALLATLAAHAATAIEAARLVREVRQRAAEIERLHELQAKILESSAIGLLLLDGGGAILAWNRALEELYGLPRQEALGRCLSDVFPLHVARRIESEGRSGESRIFRLNMVARDGRRLIVNVAMSRVGDEPTAGDLVVTLDDVTERIEMEEQMLQQERLAALGLLAAGVAHEINTPLTGISSYTQLLLEARPAGPQGEMLEKIEVQTRRASEITRSLLNLARPEDGAFEALDLNEVVREIVQLFEPQVRRGAVRLSARLDEALPPVHGSKGKLQQVLLNLLLNARDAVGPQGQIAVSTRAGDRRTVVIEVTDDGVGIPEDDLMRIFDPFFTTKGRGKGTGLGLSITFGIVQEHGGQIRAESRPGGLTRFRVELPAADRVQALA